MRKGQTAIWIILGVILIFGIVLFFVLKGPSVTDVKDIPAGTSEGGLNINVCVLDSNGNCKGESQPLSTFSTVTFQGGSENVGARWIRIFSSLTASNDANSPPQIEVTDIVGTPSAFQTALDSGPQTPPFDPDFSLLAGATNNQFVDVDFSDDTIAYTPATWTEFGLTVTANHFDAFGNPVPVSPTPSATINIRKDYDTCSDNTPWGQCSSNKPKYCQPGTLDDYVEGTSYSDGQLVDSATTNGCGCPAGQVPDPGNPDVCIDQSCLDGTTVGQCASPDPSSNDRYCGTLGGNLIEACQVCGCVTDYYGNPSTSCANPGATDGSDVCQYTQYTGSITVGLGSS